MATPIKFEGANGELLRPAELTEEQCGSLPVFRNGILCISCWQLTSEELATITEDGRVYLSVFSGVTQPPVFVGSEATLREACTGLGNLWHRNAAEKAATFHQRYGATVVGDGFLKDGPEPKCRAETSVCDINGDCIKCGATADEHCKEGDPPWHQPFREHNHD